MLVIIDSLSKDHIGAYGNAWIQTPNLDALAEESLRFTRAYPESIPTICARRAIHTGIRTWPFRDWQPPKGEDIILQGWQPIPHGQTTLAEIMQAAVPDVVRHGQHAPVQALVQLPAGLRRLRLLPRPDHGQLHAELDLPARKVDGALLKGNIPAMTAQMRQYFANVEEAPDRGRLVLPHGLHPGRRLSRVLSKGGPFFLVDCYDPHEPWDPPESTSRSTTTPTTQEPYSVIYGPSNYLLPRELERMKARYAAEITMMDRWLGRFLDKMEELGLFDNTLLILLSDHGIALGEHGFTGKPSYVLWPEITDIPFFIRHPEGKGAGQTSDYYASTHDVAPTILGFLGIEPPRSWTARTSRSSSTAGSPRRGRTSPSGTTTTSGPATTTTPCSAQRGRRSEALRPGERPRDEQRHSRGRAEHSQAYVRRLHTQGCRQPPPHLRLRRRRNIEPSNVLTPCSKRV